MKYKLNAISNGNEVQIDRGNHCERLRRLMVESHLFENWGGGTFRIPGVDHEKFADVVGIWLYLNNFTWEAEEISSGIYVFTLSDGIKK